jgi:hypothetical protein
MRCGLSLFFVLTVSWVPIFSVCSLQAQGRRPAPEVREMDVLGKSYLSLEDITQSMDGHLHWYPVSERVDLSFQRHEVQFFPGSDRTVVDGREQHWGVATFKNAKGVWVPLRFFRNSPLSRDFGRYINLPMEAAEPVAPATESARMPGMKPPIASPLPSVSPKVEKALAPAPPPKGWKKNR